MGKLDGKTAMITGGASGIGLGALELFIEEGARVLSADIQDGQADMLKARFKDRFAYAHCDVTKNADIKAVVAGAHYAVPHMRKRGGGAIVNTASICALEAGYGPVAYSTMKGAVLHFTKLAAADLAREKIRVNAICPGFIATSIFGSAIGLPREGAVQMAAMLAEKGANVQPVGRIGAPRDIAEAALYFASDASGFTTGAHLVVDGGITVGPRNSWDPDAANPIAEALGFTEGSLVEGGR
jgi:NAD(P)-dependent dehydrogenase (short-subunit alcohol dehydrogenase family)